MDQQLPGCTTVLLYYFRPSLLTNAPAASVLTNAPAASVLTNAPAAYVLTNGPAASVLTNAPAAPRLYYLIGSSLFEGRVAENDVGKCSRSSL